MSTLIETYLVLTRSITETGEIISKETVKGNSLVKAWALLLDSMLLSRATSEGSIIKDTSGVDRVSNFGPFSGSYPPSTFRALTAAAIATTGIVVGSSSAAVSWENYALTTLIAHGVGSGQLEYQSCTGPNPATISNGLRISIDRGFSNQSTITGTVRETGIYVAMIADSASRNFCIARDVIPDQVLPQGQSLNVQYRIDAILT